MPAPEMQRSLTRWLATHDGVISGEEAGALGATQSMRESLVASGQWLRVRRGVFVAASAPGGPRTELRVALALAGGVAVASHRSAAWLWGIVDQPPARPHITVPASRRLHVEGIVCHRTTRTPPARAQAGIPVTDPVRTLIDLAALRIPATAPVDRALALRLVTVDRLLQATLPNPQAPLAGRAALRAALVERGLWGAPHPSVLESHMARVLGRVCREQGVPRPEAEVAWEGGRYRLDFAWPGPRLAVEADGYVWHASAEQLDRDHARRAALTAAGWTILTFTWNQVVHDPDTVAEAISRTYRRLAAALRANGEQKDQLSRRKC